ncbi:MAG: hypothetical protein JW888_15740, partial [Pirellulales bacterium]|nr:hypothetical protein [Pirellulales bacterium]
MKTTVVKAILATGLCLFVAGCAGPLLNSPSRPAGEDGRTTLAKPAAGPQSPLARLEDSILFHPTRYPDGDWNPRGSNWDRGGLAFEDVWFQ